MSDGPFTGGRPMVGFERHRPQQHDHVGEMVFQLDPDRVARRCWCTGCGQEWRLRIDVDAHGKPKPIGWVPVPG